MWCVCVCVWRLEAAGVHFVNRCFGIEYCCRFASSFDCHITYLATWMKAKKCECGCVEI